MRTIRPGERDYPERLAERLNESDRPVIYAEGDLSVLSLPSVAIVGSRSCTAYGRSVTKAVAGRAARRGAAVISGLAYGIDVVAHRAVMEAGGRTIAVIATGPDLAYPYANRHVQSEIAERHLLISETAPGEGARRYSFPRRNRLISALADAVIIVEAGSRSGSLITAECAAEQGVPVYAVPGNITSAFSMGTNRLILDGAEAMINVDQVFDELGIGRAGQAADQAVLGEKELRVMEVLREGREMPVEEIRHRTNMKASEINGIITVLEMKGLIWCEMGKVMIAKI